MLGAGIILLLALCVPLSAAFVLTLGLLGEGRLIAPVLLWFLLWQAQEFLRRALLAEMRHAAAIPGDVISYLGQAAGLVGLLVTGNLDLLKAILVMAGTSGLAAVVQATQISITANRLRDVRRIAAEFWRIGSGSLGSNLLSALRLQIFPWTLVATGGTALAAGFQAAFNVMQATNPIVLGLCNIIPQAAARSRLANGNGHAWRTSRSFALLGGLPVFAYYAALLGAPSIALRIFYGPDSPYGGLSLAVRIMAMGALIGYVADVVCAFFHGIEQSRLALKVNLHGLGIAVAIGIPLTAMFGVVGSAAAITAANVVRAVTSERILAEVTGHERRRVA